MGAAHGGVADRRGGVADREYSDSPDDDGFIEHPEDDANGRSYNENGRHREDGSPRRKDPRRKNGWSQKENDWHDEDDLDESPEEREDPRRKNGRDHKVNGWHDEDDLDGSPKQITDPLSKFRNQKTIESLDDEVSDVPTIDEEKAAAILTVFRTTKYFNGHGDMPEGYEEACKHFTKQDFNVLNMLGDWSETANEEFSLLDTFQIAQHFYASIDTDAFVNAHRRVLWSMCLAFLVFAAAVYAMCYLAIYSLKNAYVDSDNILRNWDGSQVQTICRAHHHRER